MTGSSPPSATTTSWPGCSRWCARRRRDHGRDPSAIELSTGGRGALGDRALDEVGALADLGVDRVIVPAFAFWGDPATELARYGDEVIARA